MERGEERHHDAKKGLPVVVCFVFWQVPGKLKREETNVDIMLNSQIQSDCIVTNLVKLMVVRNAIGIVVGFKEFTGDQQ